MRIVQAPELDLCTDPVEVSPGYICTGTSVLIGSFTIAL
jgi:hypothetical protein